MVAWILIGLGALMLIGGLVMLFVNRRRRAEEVGWHRILRRTGDHRDIGS